MAERPLILATANAHKTAEMRALLAGCGWDVRPAPPGVADVPETGSTFAQNARLKAEAVANATGQVALADDSGLMVDALNGAPGVHSKRWAGEGADDSDRIARLLDALSTSSDPGRTARFICAACIAGPEGVLWEGQGTVEGTIARSPSGAGGFGYDPVFVLSDGRTMAELDETGKNAVSHRGSAMRLARGWLLEHANANK